MVDRGDLRLSVAARGDADPSRVAKHPFHIRSKLADESLDQAEMSTQFRHDVE